MGHYVCYVKNQDKQSWFLYDDESVQEVNEKKIKSKYAYILMYKWRDINFKEDPEKVIPKFSTNFKGKPVNTIYGRGYILKTRKHACPYVIKIGRATCYLKNSAVFKSENEDQFEIQKKDCAIF